MRILDAAGRSLTTLQIKNLTGFQWVTVDKHLKELQKKEIVYSMEYGNKMYWCLDKDELMSYIKWKTEKETS